MKPTKFIFFVLLLQSITSYAGDWSSGGGNAVICLNSDDSIKSADLLDVYEWRATNKKSINPIQGSELEIAKVLVQRTFKGRPDWFSQEAVPSLVDNIFKSIRFLPSGVGLQPVGDANTSLLPKGCLITQLAHYQGDLILIDTDIWNHLDIVNRGGLIAHEIVYLMLRALGETNSDRTRKAIGAALGEVDFVAFNNGVPRGLKTCYAGFDGVNFPPFSFYAYPDANQNLILKFDRFDSKPMLTETSITINPKALEVSAEPFIMVSIMGTLMESLPIAIKTETINGIRKIYLGTQSFPTMPNLLVECPGGPL